MWKYLGFVKGEAYEERVGGSVDRRLEQWSPLLQGPSQGTLSGKLSGTYELADVLLGRLSTTIRGGKQEQTK